MKDSTTIGGRDRLVQLLLTAALGVLALRWLGRGDRVRGLLAGAGAVGLAADLTDRDVETDIALDRDAVPITFDESEDGTETAGSDDDGGTAMTCAACGEPIVPGQSRGPNSDDEIVHDDCA